MGKFTVEEIDLMCVFNTKSRMELIEDFGRVLPHLKESEMEELARNVLTKLQEITDEEFAELVLEAAKATGKVVTVEEHSVIGGLGSAVCDVLSEQLPTPVLKIGVNDVFGHSGPAVELIKEFGLDGDSIAAKVKEFVK